MIAHTSYYPDCLNNEDEHYNPRSFDVLACENRSTVAIGRTCDREWLFQRMMNRIDVGRAYVATH